VTSLDAITSLRGSLIVLRRRCGKPNCHCAKGQPHTTPALSFSQNGKTRILTLTKAELPAVRRALLHHRQALAQGDDQDQRALKGPTIGANRDEKDGCEQQEEQRCEARLLLGLLAVDRLQNFAIRHGLVTI